MTRISECEKDILRVRSEIREKVRSASVQPQRMWHEVAVLITPVFRRICTDKICAAAFQKLANKDGISSVPRSGSIASVALCRFMLHRLGRLKARRGDSRIHRLSAGVMYGYRRNIAGETLLSALIELKHSGIAEDYKGWKLVKLRKSP